MPTFKEDVKLGTMVPQIRGDDIADGSVGLEHLSPTLQDVVANARESGAIDNDTIDEIVKNVYKPI